MSSSNLQLGKPRQLFARSRFIKPDRSSTAGIVSGTLNGHWQTKKSSAKQHPGAVLRSLHPSFGAWPRPGRLVSFFDGEAKKN